MRDPKVLDEAQRRLRGRLKELHEPPRVPEAQLQRAEQVVANLTEAVAQGGFRRSPAQAERLRVAEDEFARLREEALRPMRAPKVETIIVGLRERLTRAADNIEHLLQTLDQRRVAGSVRLARPVQGRGRCAGNSRL